MKYLSIIFLLFFASCEYAEYLPIVILAEEITQDKTQAEPPIDFQYHQSIPLTDTCVLMPIDTPAFIVIAVELYDGVDPLAKFGHDWIDGEYDSLEHVLQLLDLTDYTIYRNGNSTAAIVNGTNETNIVQGKIYTRSVTTKQYFGATSQGFIFYGALTADEYLDVATNYPSVKLFNFLNTNYTFDEYETIAKEILGECKLGEYWANFNHATITDSTFCKFIERDWQYVTGNNTCGFPQP